MLILKRTIAFLLLITGLLGIAGPACAYPARVYRPYRPNNVPPAYYYVPRPVYVPPVAPVVPAWQYSYWYAYRTYGYPQPRFYYGWRIR